MTGNRTATFGATLRPTWDTRISDLLKAHPEMVEVLARYHKHFELLRRTTLRKLMTPLVTIEKAARTAQVDVDEMLTEIYRAIGEPLPPGLRAPHPAPHPETTPMPEELRNLSAERRVALDVREEVRAGEEPYRRITKAAVAVPELIVQ